MDGIQIPKLGPVEGFEWGGLSTLPEERMPFVGRHQCSFFHSEGQVKILFSGKISYPQISHSLRNYSEVLYLRLCSKTSMVMSCPSKLHGFPASNCPRGHVQAWMNHCPWLLLMKVPELQHKPQMATASGVRLSPRIGIFILEVILDDVHKPPVPFTGLLFLCP